MSALKQPAPPAKMTFDEFMAWYETAEGRWELHDGVPVRLHDPVKGQAQRFGHLRGKGEIYGALKAAIAKAGLNCEAVPDGATVKIDDDVAYEPDALVYCGERQTDEALHAPAPLIVVEVLSPSTAMKDLNDKLRGYFSLPSVMHYLILDPMKETVTHYRRTDGGIVYTPIEEKALNLDPPGMVVELADLFA